MVSNAETKTATVDRYIGKASRGSLEVRQKAKGGGRQDPLPMECGQVYSVSVIYFQLVKIESKQRKHMLRTQ